MKYDIDYDEKPVFCPRCSWSGTLGQTDNLDVFSDSWDFIGTTCVCPRCADDVEVELLAAAPQAPAACATLLPAQPEKKGSFINRGGEAVGG